jgi:hypothetical protein
MKDIRNGLRLFLAIIVFIALNSCQKNNPDSSQLYVPSTSDATATATLKDLQDGRALYINNCGACHSYYLPENYSASQWRSIISSMAPRTSLSSSQVALVTKYVTKGH